MQIANEQHYSLPSWSNRLIYIVFYVVAGLCLGLAAFRVVGAISLLHPLQSLTSGYEEEALFSIWKWIHHQTVYSDIHKIPYAASYFNWGFYWLYGFTASIALKILGLGDAWIPTIARLITLGFSVALVVLLKKLFDETQLWEQGWKTSSKFLLCALMSFSPLTGFWVMTSRPDMGAVLFELAGLLYFLKYDKGGSMKQLLVSMVLFYLAWSFKQTSITVITGCCLWLIFKKKFIPLFIIVIPMFSLYTVTMMILGHDYVFALLFSQKNMSLLPMLCVSNFFKACVKFPFLAAGIVAVVLGLRSISRANPVITLCLGVSLIVNLITGAKGGASDNYFFIPGFLATFCLFTVFKNWPEHPLLPPNPKFVFAFLLCLQLISVATVVTGWQGVVSVKAKNAEISALTDSLKTVQGPVLVIMGGPGNLPWIQPHPPNFVLACAYGWDRGVGVKFEHGGIGGLIQEGYFQCIVQEKHKILDSVDGAQLDGYEPGFEDAYFEYFRKQLK